MYTLRNWFILKNAPLLKAILTFFWKLKAQATDNISISIIFDIHIGQFNALIIRFIIGTYVDKLIFNNKISKATIKYMLSCINNGICKYKI